jgi:hypothetical protein
LAKKVGKKMAKNALGCFLKRIPRKMQTVIWNFGGKKNLTVEKFHRICPTPTFNICARTFFPRASTYKGRLDPRS